MKYKSLKTPAQITQVLALVFGKHEPHFENDNFKGVEFVEPSTGCRVRIARPDSYSDSLSVMVEEPEGVIPNGYRLFGKYKNLIEVNEFFESWRDLERRVCAITGWQSFDEESDALKNEFGLEFARTAVVRTDDKFIPTATPLLSVIEIDCK